MDLFLKGLQKLIGQVGKRLELALLDQLRHFGIHQILHEPVRLVALELWVVDLLECPAGAERRVPPQGVNLGVVDALVVEDHDMHVIADLPHVIAEDQAGPVGGLQAGTERREVQVRGHLVSRIPSDIKLQRRHGDDGLLVGGLQERIEFDLGLTRRCQLGLASRRVDDDHRWNLVVAHPE